MQFMPQKVIKGQVAADLLADHLVPGTSKLYDDPDEIAEVNLIKHLLRRTSVATIL